MPKWIRTKKCPTASKGFNKNKVPQAKLTTVGNRPHGRRQNDIQDKS